MRCRGALIMVYDHSVATVVVISGEIDAANADLVNEHLRGRVGPGHVLVVDMTQIDFCGVQTLGHLIALDVECRDVGCEWVLMTSRAVRRLLRIGDLNKRLPTAP